MSWGIVASAAIAVGGSLISGNAAAKGAKDAAKTEAGAAVYAADLADEAQKRFEERMEPYTESGRAADRYINALLGLPAPSTPGPSSTTPQTEAELRARYPQEAALWDSWERKGNSKTNGHRTKFGDFTGYIYREKGGINAILPPPVTNQAAPNETASQSDYDAAMAAYENSPWAKFAAESAAKSKADANESYLSTVGARGGLTSGRTAAGLYEIAQDAEDQRFREGFTEGWYPSVTGVSDRGYNASVGVGNASLSTAAQQGAAAERAGRATADGQRAANDATTSGINAALYYAGQGVDAVLNRSPPPPPPPASKPTTKGGSASKYYGG